MKRIGNLYPKIYDLNNLYSAYIKARRHKRYRDEILRYTFDLPEQLIALQNEIIWHTYKPGKYRQHYVYVPKVRLIKALPFKDRVLQHALNNIIEPIFTPPFYEYSFACRKGKGPKEASATLAKWLHNHATQDTELWAIKADIRRYFDSVVLKILFSMYERKIKDKETLALIGIILEVPTEYMVNWSSGNYILREKGLPVGNLTSQLSANIYLTPLDNYVKEVLKPKDYIRYMDDFILLDTDKEKLKEMLRKLELFLEEELELKLNDKTRIFPVKMGVDFVGYMHNDGYKKLRKSSWKRSKKTLKKATRKYTEGKISTETFRSVFSSALGHLKHADNFQEFKRLEAFMLRTIEKMEKRKEEKVDN